MGLGRPALTLASCCHDDGTFSALRGHLSAFAPSFAQGGFPFSFLFFALPSPNAWVRFLPYWLMPFCPPFPFLYFFERIILLNIIYLLLFGTVAGHGTHVEVKDNCVESILSLCLFIYLFLSQDLST